MANSAAGGLTYESFSHGLGLASGVLLLAIALYLAVLRRRGHMIPGTIPLACLLYGLGSLVNVVGDLIPEVAGIVLVAVMLLLYLAGLTCVVIGVRAFRRRSRVS